MAGQPSELLMLRPSICPLNIGENADKEYMTKYLTKTFTKKELTDLGLPDSMDDSSRGKIISDEITDHSRWSVHSTLLFELDGTVYQAHYSVGATESQDESPWEYEETVDCLVMTPREVTVVQYEPVSI